VAPEDAPVLVQLVDDHVAQVLEELHPLRVVGEDPRVEHVGVRDHDVAGLADLPARFAGGVAVVGEGLDVGAERRDEAVQLLHLVLRERLRRKEVEGAGVRAGEDRLEDGQVVAEGLPGGGRRDDDDILPRERRLDRLGLVRVEPLDPVSAKRLGEPRVEAGREISVPRLERGQLAPGREAPLELRVVAQRIEHVGKGHRADLLASFGLLARPGPRV
jgi:hypothetical protein